jgi:O-antigen/teichoic acid export membrane protein
VVAALAAPHALTFLAGGRFSRAGDALGPAIATVALGPLTGAIAAAAAIELRAGARLWTAVAGTAGFLVVAGIFVPSHGATGATAALLAGTAASAIVGILLFPGLAGRRLVGLTAASIAAALAIGALT